MQSESSLGSSGQDTTFGCCCPYTSLVNVLNQQFHLKSGRTVKPTVAHSIHSQAPPLHPPAALQRDPCLPSPVQALQSPVQALQLRLHRRVRKREARLRLRKSLRRIRLLRQAEGRPLPTAPRAPLCAVQVWVRPRARVRIWIRKHPLVRNIYS